MIRVCSGFSPSGRVQYGERFLRSFGKYWPLSVQLLVYVEESMTMPRDASRLLWDIPGAQAFMDRHRDEPMIRGEVARACWKDRERRAGYSFRTDALKFFKQIMIPIAAALDERAGPLQSGDILVWLDADVETTSPVPASFIRDLLGDADVCFLGREPKHSEIGFWAVRISDETLGFLELMHNLYDTDRFLELREWHSAFVWDHARKKFALCERNLTPGGHGHVWPSSPLGRVMRHDKGDRKPRR